MGRHSKRVFLTLPEGVASDLERWAESEGNTPAGLAGFIVESAVREAREAGKIPDSEPQYKSLPHAIALNWDQLIDSRIPITRLIELKQGANPTELEIARLAALLRVTEELIEKLTCSKEDKKPNGIAHGH